MMDCYRYSRADLWDGKNCCDSCHEDAAAGQDCIWREVNGEELHLCCRLSDAIDSHELPAADPTPEETDG